VSNNSKKLSPEAIEEEKDLMEFLKDTKDGKYATIEKSSLCYVRIKETTYSNEGDYFYGLR
jgi:hypothetical protein